MKRESWMQWESWRGNGLLTWYHYTEDGIKTICGKEIPDYAIAGTPEEIDLNNFGFFPPSSSESKCDTCDRWVIKNRPTTSTPEEEKDENI